MDKGEWADRLELLRVETADLAATLSYATRKIQDMETYVSELSSDIIGDRIMPLKSFSQNDPEWADKIYSGTGTFGRYGCLVTCFAMIASQSYLAMNPVIMAEKLRQVNAFGPCVAGGPKNCLNFPGKIVQALPHLRYDGTLRWEEAPMPIEALQSALLDGPVIADVDAIPATSKHDQHFVVIMGIADEGRDVEIIDAWDGKRKSLLKAYGKPAWTLSRAIYGLRLLRAAESSW